MPSVRGSSPQGPWLPVFAAALLSAAPAACSDAGASQASGTAGSPGTAEVGGAATGGSSAAGPGGSSATSAGTSATTGGSAGMAPSAGSPAGGFSAGSGGDADGGDAGSAGNGAGSGNAGAPGAAGNASTCPTELVGFATLDGGTRGGGDVAPTVVTTQAELRACATDAAPRVCRVQGTLTFSPFEEIRVASSKTIIGSGSAAEIVMGGFFLASGVHDVIIRNLTIRDSYVEGQYDEGGDNGGDRDGVQMDTAHHVWIDHCRFSHLGDGQIDSRKDTTFETVSWNILENHNKAFGIGWTENVTAQITIHHNWLRHTVQRNPSTDNVLRAHLFNNLMQDISSYGNYSRGATNMVLENSVFVQVKDPHYYETGTLVASGNLYRETTGRKESSGSSSSFFEPGKLYEYHLDPASEVEALLARCAGPRAELGK
jgi:pectate lyase